MHFINDCDILYLLRLYHNPLWYLSKAVQCANTGRFFRTNISFSWCIMSIISEKENIMEHNFKPKANWNNYPKIEKCTSFGDTNNSKLDISIDDVDQSTIILDCNNKSICIDRPV